MNWDIIEGKWDQLRGEIRGKWAKLTDDDLSNLGAKKDKLIAKIQQRYGVMKEDAERQVDDWIKDFGKPTPSEKHSDVH